MGNLCVELPGGGSLSPPTEGGVTYVVTRTSVLGHRPLNKRVKLVGTVV